MVKTSTLIGAAVVVAAGVIAYLLFTGKLGSYNPGSGPDTLKSSFGLGGQGGSSGNFASGGSTIAETFTYSPNVNYSTSQTRITNTYSFDPRTGLFVIG